MTKFFTNVLKITVKYLIYFTLLIVPEVYGVMKVAIIDTGLDLNDVRFKNLLCPGDLHKDFTGEGIEDVNGHGTHVAGLIKQYAGTVKYCLIIVKYTTIGMDDDEAIDKSSDASFNYVASLKVDIVNFSSYGKKFSDKEYIAIKSSPETLFVVAVGNDGINVDAPGDEVYPAGYRLPNVLGIGALDRNSPSKRCNFSNYGPKTVKGWEIGENVLSTLPDVACRDKPKYTCMGILSGTSMAAPIRTGKIIRDLLESRL